MHCVTDVPAGGGPSAHIWSRHWFSEDRSVAPPPTGKEGQVSCAPVPGHIPAEPCAVPDVASDIAPRSEHPSVLAEARISGARPMLARCMLMRSTQAWRIASSAPPSPLVVEDASWCASLVAASCPAPDALEDAPLEDVPLEDVDDVPLDEPEPPLLVLTLASDDPEAPPSLPPLLEAPSPLLDPPLSKPERSVDDGDELQAGATRPTPRTAARRTRRTCFAYHPCSAPALHAWGQVLTAKANLALAVKISDHTT